MKKFLLVLVLFGSSVNANAPWPMYLHDARHTGRSPYEGPVQPELKWTFETEGAVSGPVIGSDSTIYICASTGTGTDGKIYAVTPQGNQKWVYDVGDMVSCTPAIGGDGTIYAGSRNGEFYAIRSNGVLKWSYSTGSFLQSSPTIGSDGTIYAGSNSGKLYAFNPNGILKWSQQISNQGLASSPAVFGTVLYIGTGEGKLCSFDTSGDLKWEYSTGGAITSSPAVSLDKMIFFGNHRDSIYAIQDNGAVPTFKWGYQTGYYVASSPILKGDTVCIGSYDGKFYALKKTGALLWSFATTNRIKWASAADSKGTVYFCSNDEKLYALNPDGTLKWSFSYQSTVFCSPAIGADGRIYVGGNSNKLFCLGKDNAVEEKFDVQTQSRLLQNLPNPFNLKTVISYQIPEDARVSLEIYSLSGQLIWVLVDTKQKAGKHATVWNGKGVTSGIYFLRLKTRSFIETKKMILFK